MARVVALDLGTWAVKATVFKGSGRRFVLEDRLSAPVVQPEDGAVPGWDERFEALRRLVQDHALLTSPGTVVGLAWPAGLASLHHIDLPFTDAKKVEQTLPFAVESEVPFDMDDMVLGWRVLARTDKTETLAALAHKADVADVLERCRALKMEPRSVFIDGELLGIWGGEEGVVAVIDLGHRRTLITVVDAGKVMWSRAIDVGGADFTRAIQKSFGYSRIDAERVKHGEATPVADEEVTDPGTLDPYTRLPAAARQVVDGAIGQMLAEIRSTLLAAEDQLGVEIDAVRLTGAGTRFGPLQGYLEQDLGLPVSAAVDAEGALVPEAFGTADALALHLVGRGGPMPIDLRRGEFAYRGGFDWFKAGALYGAPAFGFFVAAALVLYFVQSMGLGAELEDLESRRDAILNDVVGTERVYVFEEDRKKLTDRVKAAKVRAATLSGEDEPPVIGTLHALAEAFPPASELEVDLLTLDITPKTVTFKAETTGYTESGQVHEALKAHARFKDATKGEDTQVRDKIQFTVQIPVQEGRS